MNERRIVLSEHVRVEAMRRGIAEETILAVAAQPDRREIVRPGREVRQSKIAFPPEDKIYVVRVFVDLGEEEDVVVTVYRTSKIAKYWREP